MGQLQYIYRPLKIWKNKIWCSIQHPFNVILWIIFNALLLFTLFYKTTQWVSEDKNLCFVWSGKIQVCPLSLNSGQDCSCRLMSMFWETTKVVTDLYSTCFINSKSLFLLLESMTMVPISVKNNIYLSLAHL